MFAFCDDGLLSVLDRVVSPHIDDLAVVTDLADPLLLLLVPANPTNTRFTTDSGSLTILLIPLIGCRT